MSKVEVVQWWQVLRRKSPANVFMQFKLPVGRGYWFRVTIFKRKRSMRLYSQVLHAVTMPSEHILRCQFSARTFMWEPGKKGESNCRQLGHIIFLRKWIGAGTVADEITHACLWYWRMVRRKVPPLRPEPSGARRRESIEEQFAASMADISRCFWNEYWRLKKRAST